MKKFFYFLNFIIFFYFIFFFFLPSFSFGAYPKLVSTMIDAFEDIKTWLIAIATPAVAVAVGTGIFMKKFSFGDDERMRVGKKLIRTALISYALILVLDLLLSTIQNLLTSA